jgi:protein-S-isoprenylcysteine O-methyltransferase Ste14
LLRLFGMGEAVETIVQALVFVVGSVVLALLGLFNVRRRVPLDVQMEQNEVAGFFIAVLGVVYAVILAFAVIAVWEDLDEARDTSDREANSVGDLYRMAEGLPESARRPLQEQAAVYGRSVIEEEWPMLKLGRENANSLRSMEALWSLVRQYEPNGPREEAIYAKLLDEIQEINDERRMRLLASREGIPRLMWGVLIGGGVVTVLFTYFFGLKNFRAQLAMTGLYVASIGFVLFLIAAIEHPFSGSVSVRPEAMEAVIQRIELLEAARR